MRAVKTLEAAGWLGVARSNGRHANSFTLLMPGDQSISPDADIRQLADFRSDNTADWPVSYPDRAERIEAVSCHAHNRETVSGDILHADNGIIQKRPLNGITPKPERSQNRTATVAEPCDPKREEKYSPLNPPTRTGTDLNAAFEELWQIWANGTDKGKARSAFHRAVTGLNVTPETIISAARERRLRRLTGQVAETEPLARWLRKEGWAGEPASAPSRDPKSAYAAKASVFVEEGSAAWNAWKDSRKRQGLSLVARSFPSKPGRFGWYFESEWPVGSREVHHG